MKWITEYPNDFTSPATLNMLHDFLDRLTETTMYIACVRTRSQNRCFFNSNFEQSLPIQQHLERADSAVIEDLDDFWALSQSDSVSGLSMEHLALRTPDLSGRAWDFQIQIITEHHSGRAPSRRSSADDSDTAMAEPATVDAVVSDPTRVFSVFDEENLTASKPTFISQSKHALQESMSRRSSLTDNNQKSHAFVRARASADSMTKSQGLRKELARRSFASKQDLPASKPASVSSVDEYDARPQTPLLKSPTPREQPDRTLSGASLQTVATQLLSVHPMAIAAELTRIEWQFYRQVKVSHPVFVLVVHF